jgi:hypothetical protein
MSSRDAIDARVKDFVADLEKLVRSAALEAVQSALGGPSAAPAKRGPGRPRKDATAAAPVKRGPGRPRKDATAAAPAATAAAPVKAAAPLAKAAAPAPAAAPAAKATPAAKPVKPSKRKKGQKRTPEELAAVQASLESYVRANDGKRIEEISKALAIGTGELTGPMKKLIEDGRVRSTGSRRATRYYSTKKK